MKIVLLVSLALSAFGLINLHSRLSTGSLVWIALTAFGAVYIVDVFRGGRLAHWLRSGAFSGAVLLQIAAIVNALILSVVVVFGFSNLHQLGWASTVVTLIYIALIAAAFAGMFAIWITIQDSAAPKPKFFAGLAIAGATILTVFAAEFLWISYESRQLKNGNQEEVIATLDRLAKFPFRLRIQIPVCDSLIMRDLGGSFTRYDQNTLGFLPDEGMSQIKDALTKRFGPDATKVIEHAEMSAGPHLLGQCARWAEPS